MAQVVLSQQARLDLLSILEQLSDVAGPRTARTYDNDFKQTIENLSTFPGTGTPHSHIGPETRVASVEPYLIFYYGGPRSDVVHVCASCTDTATLPRI